MGGLRVNVAGVVHDDQFAHNLILLVKGQRINVHRPASPANKLALFLVLCDCLGNRDGLGLQFLR